MKITKALLILAVMLVLTATLFGCDETTLCIHEYTVADCLEPSFCTKCGLLSQDALGHNFEKANCTEDSVCTRCNTVLQEAFGHDFSDATCVSAKVCNTCGITEGEALGHDYGKATCTAPATCSRCSSTQGSSTGHSYSTATCTKPAECKNCGHVKSQALGHSYVFEGNVTCTSTLKCTKCGASGSAVKGHQMVDETCTTPAYCTVCGIESTPAYGHNFTKATCTAPKICKNCNLREGSPLAHEYTPATCTEAKTCKNCGATSGGPLGCSYSNNYCIRCGQKDPETVFENLHVVESEGYTKSSSKFTDSLGDAYENAHVYQHIDFNRGNRSAHSVHNLNKKYTKFSGTFVMGPEMTMPEYTKAYIKIFVDGKLVFEKEGLLKTTTPIDFTIDVTGASLVEIRIGNQSYCNATNHVALVNTELTKK